MEHSCYLIPSCLAVLLLLLVLWISGQLHYIVDQMNEQRKKLKWVNVVSISNLSKKMFLLKIINKVLKIEKKHLLDCQSSQNCKQHHIHGWDDWRYFSQPLECKPVFQSKLSPA